MPNGQPVNVAGEGSQVGVQALHAYIDTVSIPGNVQLTVGQDASPQAKYQAGVENLKSGNPRMARKLIWDVMMSGHVTSEVLFHWLVAMLSGRTVRQFSTDEIDQLKHSRSRYAEIGDDAWADGVRLIYRLFGSELRPPAVEAKRRTAETDMSLLVKQYDNLADKQRDMVQPHLELFLRGPRQNEMWQRGLTTAQSGQHSGGRLGRAWMFFQPVPAEVLLPSPRPVWISTADRLAMWASTCVFAAAAGYLGWELLWYGAFLGLIGYMAALAGGAVAAAAALVRRFLTRRRCQKDEQFRVPDQTAPSPSGDELTDRVDKLFKRYFDRYAPDQAERERWKAAVAGLRKLYRDEIIEMCRSSGIPANEVAWLIRYHVRRLKQRWQDKTLHEYRRQLLPGPGITAARWIGLAIVVLGSGGAAVTLWPHLLAELADAVALASAFVAWQYWLRVNLERGRYTVDREEHIRRQEEIDKEFTRWSRILRARPEDAEMAAWLGCDRTVLLGRALDHFHLPRSRLTAHAFLEQPGVAVKRARIEGGPWRYAGYRFLVFLLAEDGVRQVRANLDFMKGTLTIRERTSYRYDAIVSMRFLQETRRRTFELRLTSGDPIIVRLRDADPDEAQQDQDAGPTEGTQETGEAEEDSAPDVTSLANLLHILERLAGEGRNTSQEHERAGGWSDHHEADPGDQDA